MVGAFAASNDGDASLHHWGCGQYLLGLMVEDSLLQMFRTAEEKLHHRILTLPSLRGGLLVHALKKIKQRTGAWDYHHVCVHSVCREL